MNESSQAMVADKRQIKGWVISQSFLYLIMTTKEAFENLISKRGWGQPLGYDKVFAGDLKRRFKKGMMTIDKMEEVLEKAGYKVLQEKKWGI